MKRTLFIVALIGLGASLLVHLTALFGIDPSRHLPWVWVLHLGIFVVCIPLLMIPRKEFWATIFNSGPRWAGYAVKGFFAYALLNFLIFLYLSRGGVPEIRDDKYVLIHGETVQELSEKEYEQKMAYVFRGFSGHWMVFYLVAALAFWGQMKEEEEAL